MDAKKKTTTTKIPPGPLGYIYLRTCPTEYLTELSLLSARSLDSDVAVAPLVGGLTVESSFKTNVATIIGTRTTGLNGTTMSLKLCPTHFRASVYIFHGGRHLTPSTNAPQLSKLCARASKQFGFSEYNPTAVEINHETTSEELCNHVGLDPETTMLYLVVTEGFKEALYIGNAFLHIGGLEKIMIGDAEVYRIPIYLLQMFMPDFKRVITDPFNKNQRAIGENFNYPKPFYNRPLMQLLFNAVFGPTAVALRARNINEFICATAQLIFEENYEGATLSQDITFTALDGGPGKMSRSGTSSSTNLGPGGLEQRLASVMAGDATLTLEAIMSTAVFDEPLTDITSWPLLADQTTSLARATAIGSYLGRGAGLVGAMVFSTNSALHLTEVDDTGPMDPKDATKQSFYRFFLVPGTYVAGNPQIDRDGRPIPGHERRTIAPLSGGNQEFKGEHLALLCGFSPALLAKMLYYLERCDSGVIVGRQEMDVVRYVSESQHTDVPCDLCTYETRHACVHTTLMRLRARHPKFSNTTRGALGVFGTMNSLYSDCEILGNYAAFSALKRADVQETSKTIMQETYRASVDRVLGELENLQYIDQSVPTSTGKLDSLITNQETFCTVVNNITQLVNNEVDQLVHNLIEGRNFKMKESLFDATHTMPLTLDPYACGPCPILQLLHHRSNLVVFQDLALSQCSGVFAEHSVEGRNFRNQFQSLLRKRVLNLFNNGFLVVKPLTLALEEDVIITAPSLLSGQEAPADVFEGDITRVSIDVPKELRIKSRVLFSNVGATASEAARARVANLQTAYKKTDKRVDILLGPIGFLLKQFHPVIFPNGKPPGSTQPNPQWFWTALQRNQFPARLLSQPDIDTIVFVKKFSTEYNTNNFINLTPNNVSELALYYMANQILRHCDHSDFFINTLTAIISGSRRPPNPTAVASWSPQGGASLEHGVKSLAENIETYPGAWSSMFVGCNLLRSVMATRPMVVLGLSISKYHGMAGNDRVFQAGNWANLTGGKNVCPLLVFDRTRKFVLTCPRAGFLCPMSITGLGVHEHSLCDQLRAIILDGGATVASSIFTMVVKSLGPRTQQLQIEDWLALLGDDYLSEEMMDLNARTLERGNGEWTSEAALEVAQEAETLLNQNTLAGDEMFNFGDYGGEEAASSSLFSSSRKRPGAIEDLFEGAPPDKKGELTLDML
ncbi:ICP8 [Macropodid alphaherpesvirus 4]|uniref:ICP8 n=1 Tax=Macropodid alphaherpesvirus 4 TaxID=2762721 RepID=A0A7L7YV10_9ALPH|nr:ICP8 [Macropodid alphaherpesvirus 4]QOD40121.1 ICP8 [Macropodid alphaherpesvirus 4]